MIVVEGEKARKAGLRDLAEAVYMLIQLIPPGRVTTYGSIARLLETSPRLVGRILASNPDPIVVPCHRVVMSDGSLGGYSMKGGVDLKERLLRLEGALPPGASRIPKDRIIDLIDLLGSMQDKQ